MAYLNTQVDVSTLPAAEEIELRPVHGDYLKVLRIEWLITTLVLAAITGLLIYFISGLRQTYGWVIVLGSFLLIVSTWLLFIEKSFPYSAYAIREKDVAYRRGWVQRSLKICPFNRIQNCSVQAGPVERRFRLASLIVYTAGADGADLRIPGLEQEEADRLRQFILGQIHAPQDETI
ncbi:MAG TPA: PH domain-containing protein [Flavisolibacter sp.]|nr:PH domain-containing protein [Flavisolibacter sp.]